MPKEYLNPETLFPSQQYGFSQIVTSRGSKMVFVSGQVAWDADQALVGPDDLGAQARKALENVATAVEAAGGSLADVVSMRIYIVEQYLSDSRQIREALLEFFPADRLPTTTWVAVSALANPGFLIEIEPIAVVE